MAVGAVYKILTLNLSMMSQNLPASGKVGMPSNPTQLGYDSTLRSFDSNFNNGPWKTVALSPKKNLFSTFLPPMCRSSIENLEKVENYVTRPFEQIEDVKKYIILENNFKW